MKIIVSLLLLLINICTITTVAAEANSIGHSSHDRRLQVDRYTGYKTNAALEEVNPLLVLTQINFPSAIKTVQEAIDHALQRSGYRVDWRQSFEAYNIFSGLDIPVVHRKLNLMTLKDAIATLAGEAWQLLVDSVNRKLIIQLHAYVPWQTTEGSNGYGTHRVYPEESISLVPKTVPNRYPSDNSVPAQTELNRYPSDNSVLAQTEPNRYPSDNSVPSQTELDRYPSDNSVPAQTELDRYPSDNSVPAQTELNRYPSDNSVPAQTELNRYPSDNSAPAQTELNRYPSDNSAPAQTELNRYPLDNSVPAQTELNRYPLDNSVPAQTELNRYPLGNSMPAQTELNRYPSDNSVPAQTELNRYPSDNSVPAQTELNRYPSDNSVPAQTELNRYPSDNSVPAQTELNRYPSDNSVPASVELKHFQHEYPVLPVEQFVSDTNVAYDDVSENTVIHDEPTADAVYFGKAKTEIPIADNADLYDETSDRPRNQYSEENIKPYHLTKMSYMDNANSSDKMPNMHRVQYTPEHSAPYADLSKPDKPIPLEEHNTAPDLWSVQPVIKAKEGVGSLDEPVMVHYSSISVKALIEILIPEGWVVHYEVSDAILKQKLVSHAESSRRTALSSLFKELNLKALFYPGQAVVVVAEKEPKSYDYGHSPKFKAIDSQNADASTDSFPNPPDAYKPQPKVDTILRNAKTIKNLMNEMEPNPK